MKKFLILVFGLMVAAGLHAQCNFWIQSSGTNNCAGVTLTVMPTNGTPSSYAWTGPGGFTATTNPITALVNGNYAVTVTFVGGCTKVGSVSLSIPAPNVVMDSLAFCGNGTAKATVTQFGGTSTTFNWSNGFSENKTGALPRTSTNSGLTPGLYSVTITANPSGCSTVRSVNVSVLPPPTAVISGSVFFCENSTTVLTASGGNAYAWSNGSTNSQITVSTVNVYTVTVTGANGCTDSESVVVTEEELPTAGITGDLEICAGTTTTLTATGGTSYVWSDGTTNATLTTGTAGSYSVTTTNAQGCTDDATVTVTVNPTPTAGITGDLEICAGTTTTLTAMGGTSYVWSDGTTNATLTTGTAGSYSVTATNAQGCTDEATVTVTVNPTPTAGITGDLEICAGTTTTLTATGGTSYVWSDGTTNATLTTGTAGSYSVTATNAQGCTDDATVTVTVNPTPTAGITGDLEICAGTTTTLTATGGTSYVWSDGTTNATLTTGTAGSYSVTATNAQGCTDDATVTVTVNPTPTAGITGDLEICAGTTTTLTATGGVSYVWSDGSTGTTLTTGVAGDYSVTATNANGCTDDATVAVTVNPTPTVLIEADTLACGSEVTLTASGGTSYEWSNGATAPTISVPVGTYTVTATDDNGCVGESTILVGTLPTCVYTCQALFPNPIMAGSVLTIETNEILSLFSTTITNFLGQVIWSGTLNGTPGGSGTQFQYTVPAGTAAGAYTIETPCFQVATFIVVN